MTVINFEHNECKKINGYLNAYLDSELPLEAMQEGLRHLASCQSCALELAAREQVKKALQQAVKKDVAPFGLEQRIQRNLRKQNTDSPVKLSRWVLAIAATVILSVISFGIFQALQTGKRASAIEQAALQNATVLQVGLGNHIHCAIDKGLANKQFTKEEIQDKLGEFAGLISQLQGRLPSTYQVAIGHRCKFNNRQFVHLILKDKEKIVSVTLTAKNDEAFSAVSLATIIQAVGIDLHQGRLSEYEVTGFESNGYLAFITSNLEKQENLELASGIAPAIQDFLNKMRA
jgi:hypothetical protein